MPSKYGLYGMVPVVSVFHRIRPFLDKLNLGKVKKKFQKSCPQRGSNPLSLDYQTSAFNGNMTIARAPDPTFIVVKKSKTLSVRLCKSD